MANKVYKVKMVKLVSKEKLARRVILDTQVHQVKMVILVLKVFQVKLVLKV